MVRILSVAICLILLSPLSVVCQDQSPPPLPADPIFDPDPPDVDVLNTPTFKLPILFDSKQIKNYKEVRLYVSRDHGKTWQETAKAMPSDEAFLFTAPEDGLYWFGVKAMDQKGKLAPSTFERPARKVLVNTSPWGLPRRLLDGVVLQGELRLPNPLRKQPGKWQDVESIRLLVSRDGGKSWRLAQQVSPDQACIFHDAQELGVLFLVLELARANGTTE